MRYKHIIFFAAVATAACTVMRTLQLLKMTTAQGLLMPSRLQYNRIILVLTIAAFVGVTVFGALVHRCPTKMPVVTLPLLLVSLATAAIMVYDMLYGLRSGGAPAWQVVVMKILGVTTAVLLALYGTQSLTKVKLPPLLFALPILFWIIRLIWTFTTLNKLSLTVGHVLRLITECALLVFWLEFAKQYNRIDQQYNFKKLLASALLAGCSAVSYTVPIILGILLKHANVQYEIAADVFFLLFMGIFAIAFALTHFSQKNLNIPRHHHSRNRQPVKGEQAEIYIGMS